MGDSEEAKNSKPEATSSPPSAYYGHRMAWPQYFSSSGHSPPPYMWGPLQQMMPPYATIYPHVGVYAHPGVTVAASPVHFDSPAKLLENSDRGLVNKLKGSDGLAMSIGTDNGGSAEVGNDNGISQSGETEGGSSEGSDGNTTEGGKNDRKRSRGGSSTSSEIGKTEQVDQLPSSKNVTSLGNVTMMPAMPQNDRELKRERRKQSNRESARRSRLRKQAEAEELGTKVESLRSENLTLKSEISRLTVNSANLKLQNSKLLEKLKKAQVEEAIEDPRLEKNGSSFSTANLISRVDIVSDSGSSAILHQLLDASPRADAVAAG